MRALSTRRQRQAGFTVVEMIVALAVGAIVASAIYPMFLIVYRTYGAWSENSAAREVGLIAASSFDGDVRQYIVVGTGSQRLVLQDVANPGGANFSQASSLSAYCISYSVQAGPTTGTSLLVRSVTDPARNVLARRTVAHGVTDFASALAGNSVRITMTVGTTGGTAPTQQQVSLLVTPRIPAVVAGRQACS